ncbi:MAG: CYTH domain-containing protein [Chloroflexota bacterium]|nr:CYTH domain-containing protein [Chloroflexota bacterium]
MAYKEEIERKFLVDEAKLPALPEPNHLTQGYLSYKPTVRVRLEEGPQANKGYLTIKGDGLVGRAEFEYDLPAEEAAQLLKLAKNSLISKKRYELPVEGSPDLKWELDVFEGDNAGLIVVELEMPSYDHEFARPDWIGQDVTEESRYKNAALAQKPYKNW